MSKSINLLPKKRRIVEPNQSLLSILQKVSFIGLVIIVFASLTLFALNFDTTLPKLKQQENEKLATLSQLHGKSAKILLVKDRLAAIGTIIKQRNSYELLIDQFSKILPANASVSSLDVGNDVLAVTLSAHSLSDLSDLLDTINDMVTSKQTFKSLTIDTINTDREGQKYALSFKAGLL